MSKHLPPSTMFIALLLVACASTPTPTSQPSSSRSASQSPALSQAATPSAPRSSSGATPVSTLTALPGSGDEKAWGPMAVADDPALDGLDAGLGPGRLAIGPRCVVLRSSNGRYQNTLIWRSGESRWDVAAQEIVFNDRDVGVIRLSSGDRMRLGGAPLADPGAPDQGAPQPTWLVPPDPSCPHNRWVVHQVIRLGR